MRTQFRFRGPIAVLSAIAAVVWWGATLPAQGPRFSNAPAACPTFNDFQAFYRCGLEKSKTFSPPRTPDGRPDLQGRWYKVRVIEDIEEIKEGQYNVAPASKSLVVEPEDGRIPYQPWARAQKDRFNEKYIDNSTHCFPLGAQRYTYSISSGADILQQPGYVVFVQERLHAYRVIPTDGRPPLGAGIKLWSGDSRGRWEGNTLVVEVRNRNDLTLFDHHGNFLSDSARLVERFTLIDANTIHWEIAIDDPRTFTRPWKLAQPLRRSIEKGYDAEIWEDDSVENCHFDLNHYYSQGRTPYPGFSAIAPK